MPAKAGIQFPYATELPARTGFPPELVLSSTKGGNDIGGFREYITTFENPS